MQQPLRRISHAGSESPQFEFSVAEVSVTDGPTREDAMPVMRYPHGHALAPLWADVAAEWRQYRAARAACRRFRRQLAAVRTPADLGLFLPR